MISVLTRVLNFASSLSKWEILKATCPRRQSVPDRTSPSVQQPAVVLSSSDSQYEPVSSKALGGLPRHPHPPH